MIISSKDIEYTRNIYKFCVNYSIENFVNHSNFKNSL